MMTFLCFYVVASLIYLILKYRMDNKGPDAGIIFTIKDNISKGTPMVLIILALSVGTVGLFVASLLWPFWVVKYFALRGSK